MLFVQKKRSPYLVQEVGPAVDDAAPPPGLTPAADGPAPSPWQEPPGNSPEASAANAKAAALQDRGAHRKEKGIPGAAPHPPWSAWVCLRTSHAGASRRFLPIPVAQRRTKTGRRWRRKPGGRSRERPPPWTSESLGDEEDEVDTEEEEEQRLAAELLDDTPGLADAGETISECRNLLLHQRPEGRGPTRM